MAAVNAVLKRVGQRDQSREIYEDKWTVSEKIEQLMRLLSDRARLKFSELFEGVTSRSEVVCTFLALLELIRLKQLTAVQPEAFGEIEICRAAAAPAPAATEPVGPGPNPSGQDRPQPASESWS